MKADIDYCRDSEWVLYLPVRKGVTCPDCGSGEVIQPPQTMDMPVKLTCLRCGRYGPSGGFDR